MLRWRPLSCLSVFLVTVVGQICAEVELQYIPNLTVIQNSTIEVIIEEALPGMKLDGALSQNIVAAIKITNSDKNQSDLPISKGPLKLTFTLQDFKTDLKFNGEQSAFDARQPNNILLLAEINDIIDQRYTVYLDEDFRLKKGSTDDSTAWDNIIKRVPIFQDINPEAILQDFLSPSFVLADRDLKVGATFHIESSHSGLPTSLYYTVTEIDSDKVEVFIHGELLSQSYLLKNIVPVGDNPSNQVTIQVSGKIQGRISWDRQNALVYRMEVLHDYHGLFRVAEWQWPMNLTLTHRVTSALEEELHEAEYH